MAGLSEALGSPEMEQGPQKASSGYSLWHPEISSPLASGFVRKLRERTPFIPRALVTDVASTILLTGRVPLLPPGARAHGSFAGSPTCLAPGGFFQLEKFGK